MRKVLQPPGGKGVATPWMGKVLQPSEWERCCNPLDGKDVATPWMGKVLQPPGRKGVTTPWMGKVLQRLGKNSSVYAVSLYLKAKGLSLSVINIFNAFYWLKNNESYSVVSLALLCLRHCCFASESDFMLLQDYLFNCCRADLQSHLSDDYLFDSFDM